MGGRARTEPGLLFPEKTLVPLWDHLSQLLISTFSAINRRHSIERHYSHLPTNTSFSAYRWCWPTPDLRDP